MHYGFWIQVMGCLLFMAYAAVLNIVSTMLPAAKKKRYSRWTIVFIIFMTTGCSLAYEDNLPFKILDDSYFMFIITFITLTVVFLHERSLKPVGLALDGVGKSLLFGAAFGLAECFFWGNVTLAGQRAHMTDVVAGEVILLAPLCEEVFFRGFLHRYFEVKGRSAMRCVVYTSLIWTAIHFYGFEGSAVLFISGLLLGWIRVKTGSLAGPMLMHFLWNFMVL